MLELKEIRNKKMPFHINYGLSAFNIHQLRDWDKCAIDFYVYLPSIGRNLQRDFVWSTLQKQELILSVLKGCKLPPMAFIHYDHKVFQVIDGKQRIGAMMEFVDGGFAIPFRDEWYFFNDLDKYAKMELTHYYFVGDVGYEYPTEPISDKLKIEWFNMINFAGTPADKDHMIKLTALADV